MEQAKKLWPELEWIQDEKLREQTTQTWQLALDKSV
ncbi:MAG: phosphohydrolase, partial [Mariniphaga sp.]|nr:phosphohydrolase [Mariniphaga sp.]